MKFGTQINEAKLKKKKKKWRGVCIPRGDIPSRSKLPRVSEGCGILMWRLISSTHNLGVIQTVRRKLHTTLNNICTVLTLTWIELGTPKSLNIQSVISTFQLYQRDSQGQVRLSEFFSGQDLFWWLHQNTISGLSWRVGWSTLVTSLANFFDNYRRFR